MRDFDYQFAKQALAGTRQKMARLRDALQSIRRERMARGESEGQVAAQCGLSRDDLVEMIGTVEDYEARMSNHASG